MMNTDDRLFTVAEVAEQQRVSRETVAGWCSTGLTVAGVHRTLSDCGAYKCGRFWRVPASALTAWLEHCSGRPALRLAEEERRRHSEAREEHRRAREVLDRKLGPAPRRSG